MCKVSYVKKPPRLRNHQREATRAPGTLERRHWGNLGRWTELPRPRGPRTRPAPRRRKTPTPRPKIGRDQVAQPTTAERPPADRQRAAVGAEEPSRRNTWQKAARRRPSSRNQQREVAKTKEPYLESYQRQATRTEKPPTADQLPKTHQSQKLPGRSHRD